MISHNLRSHMLERSGSFACGIAHSSQPCSMRLPPVLHEPLTRVLVGWDDIVRVLLTSASPELFNRRIANYERASQSGLLLSDGRRWSPEILDAMLVYIQPRVVRPVDSPCTIDIRSSETDTALPPVGNQRLMWVQCIYYYYY